MIHERKEGPHVQQGGVLSIVCIRPYRASEERYGREKFSVPAAVVIMAHVRSHVCNGCADYDD